MSIVELKLLAQDHTDKNPASETSFEVKRIGPLECSFSLQEGISFVSNTLFDNSEVDTTDLSLHIYNNIVLRDKIMPLNSQFRNLITYLQINNSLHVKNFLSKFGISELDIENFDENYNYIVEMLVEA